MKTPEQEEKRIPYLFLTIFLVLAVGIISAGYFYYSHYENDYRLEKERELSSVADLKIIELTRIRKEWLQDAYLFHEDAFFSTLFNRYLNNPKDILAKGQFKTWLNHFRIVNQYNKLSLFDAKGLERLALPDSLGPHSSFIGKKISETLKSGKITIVDFYRNEYDQHIYLNVLVPIPDPKNNKHVNGVLSLRIDPELYLYPYINNWPIPSRTSETMLVRREGDDVLYLNEVKLKSNTTLSFRISLQNKHVAAVKVVLGEEGIVEGIDYKNVPVLADVHHVPNSPWSIVAKVDKTEAYAPLRERLWLIIFLITALLIGSGTSVAVVLRKQRARFYKERFQSAETLRDSYELLEKVFNNTHILMAYLDTKFNFIKVNNAYAEADEHTPDFYPGKNHFALFPYAENETLFRKVVETGQSLIVFAKPFEYAEHPERGISYWDWSLQPVMASDGSVTALVFSLINVTEHMQAQERIQKLNRVYAFISNINQAVVRIHDINLLFEEICRIAIEDGKFRMVWIGIINQQTKIVDVAASAGAIGNYLNKIKIDLNDSTQIETPTHQAIRSGKFIISNDVVNDVSMISKRDEAVKQGFRSLATFPLKAFGTVRGVIKLYSSDVDFFTEDEIKLLDEMAMDVSFALEFIETETVHKLAEEALHESEERFHLMFEKHNAVMLLIEPKSGRIVDANEAAQNFYGYPIEKLRDMTIDEVNTLPPEKVAEERAKALSNKQNYFVFPHKLSNGETRIVEVHSSAISFKGKAILFSIIHDITDRKKLELEKEQNYQIQEALNKILSISVENISLEESLEQILKTTLSLPFLSIENRGGIFLVDTEQKNLRLKTVYNLPASIQTECAQVPFGYCLCGRAAATRQIQFADCLDERHEIRYDGIQPHGHYIVPILSSDKVLGVIVIYIAEHHKQEKYEQDFLLSVANILSGLIERKLAEEELLLKGRYSQSLLRISRKLENSHTYAEVLKAAYEEVKSTIGYQTLWVYILTEDKKYFKSFISVGQEAETVMSEEGTGLLEIQGDLMLEEIAEAKEIIIIEDAHTDKRTNKEIVALMDIYTIVNVPIILFDKHLGSVGSATFGEEGIRVPTKLEREYFVSMASNLAVTLDRVHLLAERKLATENIQLSEKKYRGIFESILDVYFETAIEGTIIELSPSIENLTKGQYKRDELIGKNLSDFYLDPKARLGLVLALKENKRVMDYEIKLKNRDGSLLECSISATFQFDSSGRPEKIIGTMRDISGRKRGEEEIISQKNKFEQLFENSPIAIALLDDQDKIISINESFSILFGYFLEEIEGQDLNDIIVSPELKEEAKSYSDQTREGNQINKESYRKRKDGLLVYVQIVGVPVTINDKTVGIYGMYVDLTERKDAEDKMKVAKALAEQSDKLKSEFLAQMSHEIRTPINIMAGNVDYLKDLFGEKMDTETAGCFDGIDLASKRIIRTIDLILNVAVLQTSGYKPLIKQIDLNSEVLNKLYQEHQLSAKQKGLKLIYKCKLKETKILADEYSITQIFVNLIDNAIKYTKKGKVEILLGKNKNGIIMVEIKDTGIGMSKEFLPRIFEPFTQEDQGYTRNYDGNGLGLALVKNYCEINNAIIEVESKKNVGSTFRVIFKSAAGSLQLAVD